MQNDRSCLPEILYEKAGPGRKNAHSRILQLILAVKSRGRAVGYNVVKVWQSNEPTKIRKDTFRSVAAQFGRTREKQGDYYLLYWRRNH